MSIKIIQFRYFCLLFLVCLTAGYTFGQAPLISDKSVTDNGHFSGKYITGDGDIQLLDALNAAFESTRPSPIMANLPLLYKRDWNGYVVDTKHIRSHLLYDALPG
jgi:hypothetical protein